MLYSEERKAAVLAQMRPPRQQTIAALAEREGIAEATLCKWRSEARDQGQLLPNSATAPAGWSSDDKFNAVLETATLSESETAEYCRGHGLYSEQIAQWRAACAQANDRADRAHKASAQRSKARQHGASVSSANSSAKRPHWRKRRRYSPTKCIQPKTASMHAG